jgi:hypothetical protein
LIRKLIACVILAFAPLLSADNLLLDGIDVARESSQMRPIRGRSMESVRADFGTPSSQQAAVGEPPISRWDYPGFSVYFEHQHVVHAVAIP